MSPATTTTRRWRPLLGLVLGITLALGTALVASGASRNLAASPSSSVAQSQAGDCSSVIVLAAHSVAATSSTGNASAVTAARSQALTLARTTASADVRESVQNLADDLAAFRVTLTAASTRSAPATQRRGDVSTTIHGDLEALRKLCGR